MSFIQFYHEGQLPSTLEKEEIVQFLFHHLQQYGDPQEHIGKAVDYALSLNGKPGGFVAVLRDEAGGEPLCAVVVNKTGMDGYIPENILVYIATHSGRRGQGIGKKMMQAVLDHADGGIALHVEPDNPARRLYESLGFTNKYLEMRLTK